MKLVTVFKKWCGMGQEYVAGKCNIGRRGRAMRLTTGLVLIALSILFGIIVVNGPVKVLRLVLVLPVYVGLLAALEGSMSFCVLHAVRGTYDFHEPLGFATSRSQSLQKVGSDDRKRIDRRKALRMNIEALTGAAVIVVLLALA